MEAGRYEPVPVVLVACPATLPTGRRQARALAVPLTSDRA